MANTEIQTIEVRLPAHLNYDVIRDFKQPITASQLSRQTGMPVKPCNYILTNLAELGFLRCLNPQARRSRLYWLTYLGQECQAGVHKHFQLPRPSYNFPNINWKLYGEVCYSHRAVVIKTLTRPMQPSEIKRMALRNFKDIRMSANNVRDVIRFLKGKGIVVEVKHKKKKYPSYELSGEGQLLRRFVLEADVRK